MSQSNVSGVGGTETKDDPQMQNLSKMDLDTLLLVSDTLKRNPKSELSQSDLLKLLCYLEGELQARDVVIATLRSENLKHFIASPSSTMQHTLITPTMKINDPSAALFRDHVAMFGNVVSKESSAVAMKCELDARNMADQRMKTLEELIVQQRRTQFKMVNVLKNVESKQKQLVLDLDEERRKHEEDTAQGDDITYGLELERTRLRQELDEERETKKKHESELKKLKETVETEQTRQKHIVLFLLVERKKIITKYIEEKKRSEDLAHLLTEEKMKVNNLSEDLEEESKKSLRMEAEIEKQTASFELERSSFAVKIAREEAINHEKDMEIKQLREELEELRKLNGRPNVTGKFISQGKSTTGIAKSVMGTGQALRSTPMSIASKNPLNPNPPQPPLKKSAILASATSVSSPVASTSTGGASSAAAASTSSRGNPPPIPPNKPVIPVKRDQNSRIPFATASSVTSNNVAAAAAAVAAAANINNRSVSCDFEDTAQPLFSSNITK